MNVIKDSPQNNATAKKSLIFSISDKLGSLSDVLQIFKNLNLNLARIESRPSKNEISDYDFFVDFVGASDDQLDKAVELLHQAGCHPNPVVTQGKNRSNTNSRMQSVKWFPRKIADLDDFNGKTLAYGAELSADHPGFTDKEYVARREEIARIAKTYKHGRPLPRIDYTKEEIDTWRAVYTNLTKNYPQHACKAHNYVFPLLQQNCGYSPDNIPQLEDVSRFLHDCTGFTLRPVTGLLSSRDFLNGFAFRVFHATQYIRHHSVPLYTPEPDVCHELLGHVPLFADPDFADFSHEIGLASLGASDEDIERLATCYWFTVEFGLCKEDGQIKAYGAGLLSSYGELLYSVGQDEKKPQYIEFDPFVAASTKYPITEYQPSYFVAESFASAKQKLKDFSNTLDRPFAVRYNALTQSVDILDRAKIPTFVKEIQSQLDVLNNALQKLPLAN